MPVITKLRMLLWNLSLTKHLEVRRIRKFQVSIQIFSGYWPWHSYDYILLNEPFLSDPSSSGVDGSIYSLAEEPSEGQLDIQPRSQTMDNLAISVLSDNNQTQYCKTNSFDRFPFSSRQPQFNPNLDTGTNKTPTTTNQKSSPQLYYASKNILKSKPSLSNPNVLFCSPDDMTRSIIYWSRDVIEINL